MFLILEFVSALNSSVDNSLRVTSAYQLVHKVFSVVNSADLFGLKLSFKYENLLTELIVNFLDLIIEGFTALYLLFQSSWACF